jgi:hypothetical protein
VRLIRAVIHGTLDVPQAERFVADMDAAWSNDAQVLLFDARGLRTMTSDARLFFYRHARERQRRARAVAVVSNAVLIRVVVAGFALWMSDVLIRVFEDDGAALRWLEKLAATLRHEKEAHSINASAR